MPRRRRPHFQSCVTGLSPGQATLLEFLCLMSTAFAPVESGLTPRECIVAAFRDCASKRVIPSLSAILRSFELDVVRLVPLGCDSFSMCGHIRSTASDQPSLRARVSTHPPLLTVGVGEPVIQHVLGARNGKVRPVSLDLSYMAPL